MESFTLRNQKQMDAEYNQDRNCDYNTSSLLKHTTMRPFTKGKAHLPGLPIEIILDIYQQLDLGSIYKLAQTSKQFLDLFRKRKAVILIPVLTRDFSPFDELLQVHTASAEDLDAVDEIYRPRMVIFKRFPGDKGYVLAPHSRLPLSLPKHPENNGFKPVINGRLSNPSTAQPKTVILVENDLDAILKKCHTVQQWAEWFPQIRWYHEPENCRSLRPHEQFRFRRALYRWWLYGIYFHRELPRPHVGLPSPYARDIRLSHIRYYATSELLEAMDLVETMKDVILHYICPRLDPNEIEYNYDVPLTAKLVRRESIFSGWVDQSCWGRIIKTYAKLGPEDLLYYFENIYNYPRKRLISDIHLKHPNFTLDQESIQVVMRCVLDERNWLEKPPSLADDSVGGIIDFDDERDEERLTLGNDASPDGLPASGSQPLQSSQSRYSPRGDDGSNLEDNALYQAELERLSSTFLDDARRW